MYFVLIISLSSQSFFLETYSIINFYRQKPNIQYYMIHHDGWNNKFQSQARVFQLIKANEIDVYSFSPWLFVCFSMVLPPTREFFIIMRASNFDLCSALKAIEQWQIFSVPHLWQGGYVYNGHLRGPAALTPVAERLAVGLSLPVFTI